MSTPKTDVSVTDDVLLPCPFCGKLPAVEMTGFHLGARTIRCETHDCMGPHTTAANMDDATAQWNHRALPRFKPDQFPDFYDPHVQIVYTALCDPELNTSPNREEHWEGWISRNIVAALRAAPAPQGDAELYRIRDLIASHIACESDCQKYSAGCGCALTAARAVVDRPHSPSDAGAVSAKGWERLAWDWQKRAFDAEAKLAALASAPPVGREDCGISIEHQLQAVRRTAIKECAQTAITHGDLIGIHGPRIAAAILALSPKEG